MAKQIKFTEEEVKQIDEIRNQTSVIFQRLGQLSVEEDRRLQEIKQAKEDLNKQLALIGESEKKIFTDLNTKYGDGNYDPDTNVFTPIKQENQEQPVS
jgi:D-alanine-D-alanine ligase-like ATP-grasp enzyme